MENKDYCIIGMDNVSGLMHDIEKISCEPINVLMGSTNSALVATFKSKFSPEKINDNLNTGNNRSFFVFELHIDSCVVHIDDPKLHPLLFSEFENKKKIAIKSKDNTFLDYNEEILINLSEGDRTALMDKLIDDVTNLTNNQKKTLSFLASL